MGGVREPRRPSRAREVREALERGGQDLQDLVDLLRDTTGVAMATVTVLDAGTFCFTTVAGAAPFETEHDQAVCRWSMPHDRVFSIEDLSTDPRTATLPFVDGRRRSLRFYASAPLHAPDGDPVGGLCLFGTEPRTLAPLEARLLQVLARDVSAIIALRLADADRDAAGTPDEALVDFARLVHELRTPLLTLRGSLQMARDALDLDAASLAGRMLAMAQRSSARLEELVDAVLRLASHQAPEVATIDLDDLVAGVLEGMADTVSTAGAQVLVEPLGVVRGDPAQLAVVVQNLVGNACKFTRPGVRPVVRVRAVDRPGARRVEVLDNGPGVPDEHAESVFGLFRRYSRAEGYGIGLSTVAAVVRGHGGSVGVGPNPDGPGSCFWFELPHAGPHPGGGWAEGAVG
jgi:signal transduction histidine kinase